MTLEAKDRPNNAGGQDPDSEGFWTFLSKAELRVMGLVDCLYTWRSTNDNTMPSQQDRFLYSIELAESYPLADVQSLLRPLLNHTSIIWAKNKGQQQLTYFKVDRLWLREDGFKEEVERTWSMHDSHSSETKRLADKIKVYRGALWCY